MPIILCVLFLLVLAPIILAGVGALCRAREFEHFDNKYPRLQQQNSSGLGARALAAQNNAWENLLVFTVVVFIAYAVGVDLAQLGTISLIFLTLRVLHAIFYLANLDILRSASYGLGLACCIYIFVIAVQRTQIL